MRKKDDQYRKHSQACDGGEARGRVVAYLESQLHRDGLIVRK
jgi:hypothetical protein